MLTACGSEPSTVVDEERQVGTDTPVGHYNKGPIDLWIRDDSLFILREGAGGTVASGRFGRWEMLGERLDLGLDPKEGHQYELMENGLRRINSDGAAPVAFDRIDPPTGKRSPVMHLIGAYRSIGSSHMFTPCGVDRAFPLAVGEHVDELFDVYPESMQNGSLPLLLEIDASFGPGPAMEGEGEEEYIWLERVGAVRPVQECPR